MQANDVVLKVRDRLRDNDHLNGLKFSDESIMDALNDTGRDITRDLNINITHLSKHLSQAEPSLSLPKSKIICKIHKVIFNGKDITHNHGFNLLSQDNRATFYNPAPFVYSIMPFNDGTLEMYVGLWNRIRDKADFISSDEHTSDLLTYGVLMRLFQIENHENNLQRVNFYAQSYKAELQNARAHLQAMQPSEYLTPFRFF